MNAVETEALGRRFGRRWALRHLSLEFAEQTVVGLVGPNGAGKSTLLHLIAGLIDPSEGAISVLGGRPGSPSVLRDTAFVAQDAPLPGRLGLGELLAMTQAMNDRWDAGLVRERCRALDLRDDQRVASLSGGQRAQLALAIALAKQPRLLLLDEPVASLDPLARRGFLQALMASVAERELTVVLSTHLLDDLERTCDHLAVLDRGAVRLAGSIDDVLARHAVLVGPVGHPLPPEARPIHHTVTSDQHQQLVEVHGAVLDPAWRVVTPTLEEIVLAHLAGGPAPPRRLEAV